MVCFFWQSYDRSQIPKDYGRPTPTWIHPSNAIEQPWPCQAVGIFRRHFASKIQKHTNHGDGYAMFPVHSMLGTPENLKISPGWTGCSLPSDRVHLIVRNLYMRTGATCLEILRHVRSVLSLRWPLRFMVSSKCIALSPPVWQIPLRGRDPNHHQPSLTTHQSLTNHDYQAFTNHYWPQVLTLHHHQASLSTIHQASLSTCIMHC